MTINRVAAQQIIKKVPTKLRDAARAERKVIINESKKDPIGTSIRAAHGQFDFVNNEKYTELFSDDYAEYGIGIEKSIDRFNIALHLNRHDGGRTGWNGGVNIKYIF